MLAITNTLLVEMRFYVLFNIVGEYWKEYCVVKSALTELKDDKPAVEIDDIDLEEDNRDGNGNFDNILNAQAKAPKVDANAKNDELTIDKLKKGNEKNNIWFDNLRKSIKGMKTKCYPLVNNIIHLLIDSIKDSYKDKKSNEAKIKELELQIYASLQILEEGGEETAQVYQDIQNDDEKQIYFYEINRRELLQEMRDQTLKIKEHNDMQKRKLEEDHERVLISHTEIKNKVKKKQEEILNKREKFRELFDFFKLIDEQKYEKIDNDPELPIEFEAYMKSEDDKFKEYYGKQLNVSLREFIL